VLTEPLARPGRELIALLAADGWWAPVLLGMLLALAAGGVLVEAVLFRALFAIGGELTVPEQRLGGVVALLVFVGLLLALELPIWTRTLALGRRLEGRARLLLLDRLARVHDRYFRSRLVSDMAERCHRLHELRTIGELGAELLRAVFGMVFTGVGIVWLAPDAALPVGLGVAFCLLAPLVAQPLLTESDLRLRNHAGGLLRFHLDALLGLVPLRAHAAGRIMQSQHAALLTQWSRAGLRLQRRVVGIEAVQSIATAVLAAVVLSSQGTRPATAASSLLLVYWVLSLPASGQQIGVCARRFPALRSITLRFLELIGASHSEAVLADSAPPAANEITTTPADVGNTRGVAIRFEQVQAKAAGLTLLADIDLEIAAGSHVAIVGASGAGKSSLVGLLLGVHEPIGRLSIDGVPLDPVVLAHLRACTAWVDPGVQLWNRSLLENVCYGGEPGAAGAVGAVIDRSGVAKLLDSLPDGMRTALGEGGTLLSGGEGQRVRLARAAMRDGARLAILDEPFRGLTREIRVDLLGYARELWRAATLLCVTHDIDATLAFDRVLVVEDGRVVEHGAPQVLAARASHYARLLAAERTASASWSATTWRHLRLERGQLAEATPEPVA
jgi:ATP-binding cassette subfamily B protein